MKVKEESDDHNEGSEMSPFCPLSLGLLRIGTELPPKPQPTQPIQKLNARGMPARIRKKNKLFFDDDIVNDKPVKTSPPKKVIKQQPTPVKTPTKILKKRRGVVSRYMKSKDEKQDFSDSPTPMDEDEDDENDDYENEEEEATEKVPIEQQIVDKRLCQKIGLMLRNLLKLPKAHKFVSYEFFYSTLDRALFAHGENDFEECVRDNFSNLKTRLMTRIEWNMIRRLLGKPRRMSPQFFRQEIASLERRRQKIRILQAKKFADASFIKSLPSNIPMPITIGTKITARLRKPQDGLFTGVVDAFMSASSCYSITFDRAGLGTHSIPDFEVYCNEPVEMVPLDSLIKDFRPKLNNPCYLVSPVKKAGPHASLNKSDPLLGGDSYPAISKARLALPKSQIGGYPIRLLEFIIRTKKTLSAKQMKLNRLKGMNSEAEIYRSYRDPLPEDYQKRYGALIIGMEKLNRDLVDFINQLQTVSTEVLQHPPHMTAMLSPSYLREKCKFLGKETFERNNGGVVIQEHMIKLICYLTTIMYVTSNLNNNDQYNHVNTVLNGIMEESKTIIHNENQSVFQKCVHTHIKHIQFDLAQSKSS